MISEQKEEIKENTETSYIEIGETGIFQSCGYIYEDFIPELRAENKAHIFDEMRKSDIFSPSIHLLNQILLNIPWKMDENKSPKEADLCWSMLEDMEKPFQFCLEDFITFIPFGFSLCEKIWKKRLGNLVQDRRFYSKNNYRDGLIAPRKLPLRSQKTIHKWEFDRYGTILGVYQVSPFNSEEIYIPIEKLLHFRTTTEGDNPEGLSIMRGSYDNYQYCKKLKRIEAIGAEKDLVGIPVLRLPSKIMSSEASDHEKELFAGLKKQGANVKKNTQSVHVLPSDSDEKGKYIYDMQLLQAGGQRLVDTNIIIERYESNMAIQMLTDFLFMGAKKAGGTYNLAEVKIELFVQSLEHYLDVIEIVLNDSLIPDIYDKNGWDKTNICKLKHGAVDTLNFEKFANGVMKLAQVGIITNEKNVEKEARRRCNVAQIDETEEKIC